MRVKVHEMMEFDGANLGICVAKSGCVETIPVVAKTISNLNKILSNLV